MITIKVNNIEYSIPRNMIWKISQTSNSTVYYITKSKTIISYD